MPSPDRINLRFDMPWLGSTASDTELHPCHLHRRVSLPKFSLGLQKALTPELKDDSVNNPYLSYTPSQKGN